ncbi:GNAT family N-acetyltransferase [Clostridium estertheticum]|uniref:GNAT family N-acetyltransferase n=1 Tax=Clostridium estertheticum TaxID=238834 RepID=UPI0013E95E5F|nr:GNAT family N-acetyltransferase [Clostridium estertheticum]MBZ9687421.1 GNAT family N-acetyltransferase [Clostridium estertheticum]
MISIQGDKICLRTFTREEYHEYWKSYVADSIMDPDLYVYDKKRVDIGYDSISEKESWYPRVGIFLPTGTPIGELSLKRINHEKSQCELGIVLVNGNYNGLGYGTEAVELAIDYVFNTLELKFIYADTMGSNFKMQSIFGKFGFEFVNREEHCYDMHDRWEDKLNYILRNPNITKGALYSTKLSVKRRKNNAM